MEITNIIKANKKPIVFYAEGNYALFSEPATCTGGEKLSYPIPTQQAMMGMANNIFWVPEIVNSISRICPMNEIATVNIPEAKSITKNMTDHNICNVIYLSNVKYLVELYIDWPGGENAPKDRNYQRYEDSFRRCLWHNGRYNVFLGTSECAAFVYPAMHSFDEEAKNSFYANSGEVDFGAMYNRKIYENQSIDGHNKICFWRDAKMINGIITYPEVNEENYIINDISKISAFVSDIEKSSKTEKATKQRNKKTTKVKNTKEKNYVDA